MKKRLEELVAALRRGGVAVGTAEAMDAARAAALVGVERPALREALAATLVKDERDRAVFVAAFDAVFPARVDAAALARRRRARGAGPAGGAESGGTRGGGRSAASGHADAGATVERSGDDRTTSGDGRRRGESHEPSASEEARLRAERAERCDREPGRRPGHDADDVRARADRAGRSAAAVDALGSAEATLLARLARERELRDLAFRAMTPVEVEAAAELARAIAARVTARVRRRLRPRPTGRLDFRRTIRAAVPRGGVPFERRWRGSRPGKPDLVALCDLSASTATATDFFLALLAPSATYFRRIRLFGFVDRLVEIEFVDGQVRPAAPLDLMARSDFGRVLRDLVEGEVDALTADSVLVVLGDARNNRRPPRADLLAAARARVRRAVWLNPEPRERWNTGDSVIAAYARHVDAVVACGTLAELERALAAVARL